MKTRSFVGTGAVLVVVLSGIIILDPIKPSNISASGGAEPDTIKLIGTVRDFRERSVTGGHPDFERQPNNGFGHYAGNIGDTLGEDRKPVYVGGGRRVETDWIKTSGAGPTVGTPICHCLFDPARGDLPGTWGAVDTGSIQSADSFNQWYNDVPGVNLSTAVDITLVRGVDGSYVFDDKFDMEYMGRGGFFPIDNQLFGNSSGTPNHNYHFTYELHTEFDYDESANQVFQFIGDDDVWVFINGKKVIDLGGVHVAHTQFVELNRLGLTDGETYNLDFFFAERHRSHSNFKIQTNLMLRSQGRPTVTTAYD